MRLPSGTITQNFKNQYFDAADIKGYSLKSTETLKMADRYTLENILVQAQQYSAVQLYYIQDQMYKVLIHFSESEVKLNLY